MKKALFLFGGILGSVSLMAQANEKAVLLDDVSRDVYVKQMPVNRGDLPETPLWAEDFGNGFPAGWGLFNPTGYNPWKWSTGGSHGNFNGNTATAPSNPLLSTTGANGFLINDPDSANHFQFGQPSGTTYQYLESYVYTNRIDLGAVYGDLVLEFQQSFRFNNSLSLNVLVSTDSLTWTTFDVKGGLTNNTASPNPMLVTIPLQPAVGNTRYVYLAWGWDPRVYFWMIDDINIRQAPPNAMSLTPWQGAPESDILYRPNNPAALGNGKYGHMPQKQTREIAFDANVYNWGSLPQTNVKLEVTIFDANSNVVTTLSSPTTSVLLPLDTLTFDSLTTANWIPNAQGEFVARYQVLSDSINANGTHAIPTDSIRFFVTDTILSTDFGVFNNVIGTNSNFGEDACSFMPRMDLMVGEQAYGVWVRLSTQTQPGGTMQLLIHDTTGLNLTSGFPPSSFPLASRTHVVTAADITNGFVYFPIVSANGDALALNGGSYYVEVILFSNALANPILLANDQTVAQPGWSTLFFSTRAGNTPRYFTGFSGSRQYASPHIRLITCEDNDCPPRTSGINLEAINGKLPVEIYPNPTTGIINLDFSQTNYDGVNVRVVNANGKLVRENQLGRVFGTERMDLTGLPQGLYFMTLKSHDGLSKTFKVMIQ
jgi:hypothetical protein